ncbi:MAG: hypothetical protein WC700_01035 [Gemmatimonadaceae bacterium]|jgi:hypothetical protein
MSSQRFLPEHLDPLVLSSGVEDAFAAFASQVLALDLPHLRAFPTNGKDGGIDFLAEAASGRIVGDYKYLSDDGVKAALKAWHVVEERLRRNLSGRSSPAVGQAQYAPWFSAASPIREYRFVVSSELKTQAQYDALEARIRSFFEELSGQPYFAHLDEIAIRVWAWADLSRAAARAPHLLLRWFPRCRPSGLVLLDDEAVARSFRAYLQSGMLPFYGRGLHASLTSPHPTFADETALLDKLDHRRTTGLIVTGSGGVGKSRLALELAKQGARRGWLGLRAVGRVGRGELAKLAELLTPQTICIVAIDYVETQPDFEEFVESVNTLNDTYGLRLYYVASCRTAFYRTLLGLPRHERVDLSPLAEGAAAQWEKDYRVSTVLHILRHCDLDSDARARAMCRDVPAFAVFLSYLKAQGRDVDLAALLNDLTFAGWIARRVQASFGQQPVGRDLATVAAQFPFPESRAVRFNASERTLLDHLAADGWAEIAAVEGSTDKHWLVAHDVIADQLLLSAADAFRPTVALFVDDVLSFAERLDNTSSAVGALQRVQDDPLFNGIAWLDRLGNAIARAPVAWRASVAELLSTPLLEPSEVLRLVQQHGAFWIGAEDNVVVQNRIGWLARRVVRREIPELAEDLRSVLVDLVTRAARRADRSNFVLSWGVRLAPEAVASPALAWLHKHPILFQSHYLYVSWLTAGLDRETVRDGIRMWFKKHATTFQSGFLVSAWLDEGGDAALVQEPVATWTLAFGCESDAARIYRAWVQAGGALHQIRSRLLAWLESHGEEFDAFLVHRALLERVGPDIELDPYILNWLAHHNDKVAASYIHREWLQSGRSFEQIREAVLDWFHRYRDYDFAEFVLKPLAVQKSLPSETLRDILHWCLRWHESDEAAAKLALIVRMDLPADLVADVLTVSEAVLGPQFAKHSLDQQQSATISALVARLSVLGEDDIAVFERINQLLLQWMRHPNGFEASSTWITAPTAEVGARVVTLLKMGRLDITTDVSSLDRFSAWLAFHSGRKPRKVREMLAAARDC